MSKKPLNFTSGMPQMGAAFQGWQNEITLQRVAQDIVDGLVVDNLTSTKFNGVIQPLSPRALALKPDNLRSWTWIQIHAFAGTLNLTTNDLIVYNGAKYKVMGFLDYSLNNYVEYHVVEAFKNGVSA